MAMDVEYEEYSTTSSSKHHGWKLEVSRRHRETSEMETLESRIAEEYAKIDHGISVGDLTAPRAARLVAEMDRSKRLIGLNGHIDTHRHYITYPDREGLCGALPSLASSALEPNEREGERTNAFPDGVPSAKEVKNAKDKDAPPFAPASALLETHHTPDRVSVSSRKSLASRLADAMPLVRRNDANVKTQIGDDRSPRDDSRAVGALVASGERRAASARASVSAAAKVRELFAHTRRPDRLVEYDFSIGVDRARELTDAELHERAGAVNRDGEVAETAFRDLNRVD
jgi:hypothetical protein